MVARLIVDHDRRVNLPRHVENLRVAKEHTELLGEVLDNQNRVKGGITTLKWIGSILGICLTILGIILNFRLHH